MSKASIVTCLLAFCFPGVLRAEVTVKREASGGFLAETGTYSVTIGKNGFLQSIKVGGVEFLGRYERLKTASFIADYIKGGSISVIQDDIIPFALTNVALLEENKVVASGKGQRITYVFDEEAFHIEPYGEPRRYYLLFPSADVYRFLDRKIDKFVGPGMSYQQVGALGMEGMRWASKTGPMLLFSDKDDGYAEYYWWCQRPSGVMAPAFQTTEFDRRVTITPVSKPDLQEAVQIIIDPPSKDFFFPGDRKVDFNISAFNLSNQKQDAEVRIRVLDYLTQEPVKTRERHLVLTPGNSIDLDSVFSLDAPGPYRGEVELLNNGESKKTISWVFCYAFENYKPALTREKDFQEFWQDTLNEVRAIPMDAKMKLNEKRSTEKTAVYEVSIASLDGRRVWGWYCRPRQDGVYPLQFNCPPTGVHSTLYGDGGGRYCTFQFTVHGFNLQLSDMPQGPHPWKAYITLGLADKKTTSWRWIYASMVRCMDFVSTRKEVDQKRILVTGSSQGGGLALVLAALANDKVAACFSCVGGLPRLDWTVKYKTGYWPFTMAAKPKQQSEEQFLRTLSYFDAANFTPDIKCPTLAMVGLMDWVTASGNLLCALAHLAPGQIQILSDPRGGHGSIAWALNREFWNAQERFMQGKPVITKASK